MEHAYDYLIVGAGMAADAAVRGITEADADAHIGVVGDEPRGPYERPPLSKALWKQDKAPASVDLGTAGRGAEVITGRRIVELDRDDLSVSDSEGDVYRYRRLLLSTGATPRTLPFAGDERVIHYRAMDDYLRLRRLAVPGTHVAVVGAGFIGAEMAAAMAIAGCTVTLLFPGESIGAGRFPDGLADFLDQYYRDKGVGLRRGVRVVDGRVGGDGVELALSDGETLRADVVVAGLGVTPNTALAEHAGLEVDDGIVVDGHLRSSDPAIWAAGDVARFHSPALGRDLRVEHENAAIGMGHHAGRVMAGIDGAYITLPFFYSDLFDLGYEAVGLLDARLEIFEDWRQPYREGVVYYLDNGRVRGVLLWNVWGQVDAARDLIAQPGPIDSESLRHRLPAD